MHWLRRIGWILLLIGSVIAIPTYNAAGTRSRLNEEARFVREAASWNQSPDDTRRLEYAEAKYKEAEAAHGRWLTIMFGGLGSGVITLAISFTATRITRRKPGNSTNDA